MSTFFIISSISAGESCSPISDMACLSSEGEIRPLPSLSKILKCYLNILACWSFILEAKITKGMIEIKMENSMVPTPLPSTCMRSSWNSKSVAGVPMLVKRVRSSLVVMMPSLSLSKKSNYFLNSFNCSSVKAYYSISSKFMLMPKSFSFINYNY